MKADEAADMMDTEASDNRFKQRAAVLIAVLAMALAITGLGGSNAGKEAVNNNILASNLYSFFQAKNMRQTSYALAAEQIELAFLNDPALPAETKTALRAKAEQYRKTVTRYESEPETGEGKKELIARASVRKAARSRAAAGPLFRLCRSAAADRDRSDLGVDRRQSRLARRLRRSARRRRRVAHAQRIFLLVAILDRLTTRMIQKWEPVFG